jgi:hypothetical protein
MQERKKLRKSGRAGRTWRAALPDAQGIARKDWADTGENGVERRSDWRGVKGAPFVYVWFSPRA